MKFRKTKISAAIIVAVIATSPAVAEWVTPSATIDVIIQSKANSAIAATTAVEFQLAALPTQALGTNDTVTFTLTNGATFAAGATPDLLVGGVAGFSFDGFFNGRTEITFTTGNSAINAGDILALNTNIAGGGELFDLTGVTAGSDVDILITTKKPNGDIKNQINQVSLDGTTGPTFVPLFNGKDLLTCAAVAKTDTVDVATVFKEFVGPFTLPHTKILGTAVEWTLAPNNPVAAGIGIAANQIVLTLDGSVASSIDTVSATDFSGSDDAGVVGPVGGGVAGGADFFSLDAATGLSYASNTAAANAAADLVIDPVFKLSDAGGDGDEVQEARTFTLSAQVLDNADWIAHTVTCPSAVTYEIDRNGSSFTMNSFGPLNTLKISDTGGNVPAGSGKIRLMGWNAAGTELASSLTPANLTANGTVIIAGPDVISSFPSGVQRIDVTVESESIKASSVKADPTTGFKTTTVYTNQEDVGSL